MGEPNIEYLVSVWEAGALQTDVTCMQVSQALDGTAFGDPRLWGASEKDPRGRREKGFSGCAKKWNLILKR